MNPPPPHHQFPPWQLQQQMHGAFPDRGGGGRPATAAAAVVSTPPRPFRGGGECMGTAAPPVPFGSSSVAPAQPLQQQQQWQQQQHGSFKQLAAAGVAGDPWSGSGKRANDPGATSPSAVLAATPLSPEDFPPLSSQSPPLSSSSSPFRRKPCGPTPSTFAAVTATDETGAERASAMATATTATTASPVTNGSSTVKIESRATTSPQKISSRRRRDFGPIGGPMRGQSSGGKKEEAEGGEGVVPAAASGGGGGDAAAAGLPAEDRGPALPSVGEGEVELLIPRDGCYGGANTGMSPLLPSSPGSEQRPAFERTLRALVRALDSDGTPAGANAVAQSSEDGMREGAAERDEEGRSEGKEGAEGEEEEEENHRVADRAWVRSVMTILEEKPDSGREWLRRDRGGIAVSTPLRLTQEALAGLRWGLFPDKKGEDVDGGEDAGAPGIREAAEEEPNPFRLPGFEGYADAADGASDGMEFLVSVDHDMDGYVPEGYEDFAPSGGEGGGRPPEEEEEEQQRSLYIFEIVDARPSLTEDRANRIKGPLMLMDYAVLSEDGEGTSEGSLSVTFMTSSRLVELLKIHGESYEAARDALVGETSLVLPRVVGAGGGEGQRAWGVPLSLVAVVTVSDMAVDIPPQASFQGDLCFQLGRCAASFPGECPDPFLAEVSLSRFYVGRAVSISVSDPSSDLDTTEGESAIKAGENTAECPEGDNEALTAKEFLRKAMLDADCFVPKEKKRQWDEMPDALISVEPYQQLDVQLARWMQAPGMRCSLYDPSFANCLLHLESEFLLPPMTTYVTKQAFAPLLGEFSRIQEAIQQNVNYVQSESRKRYFANSSGRRHLSAMLAKSTTGTVVERVDQDATDLAERCYAVEKSETPDNKLRHKMILQDCAIGYAWHIVRALSMERLRCLNDMKRHDLYSVIWNRIELAPPMHDPHRNSFPCWECNRHHMSGPSSLCAYHSLCMYKEQISQRDGRGKGAPIPIVSKNDLEMFSLVLHLLSPGDRLVAKLKVKGVAENYPLVSMGDLVRFRFSASGLTNEIVGEVVDVVIKSEVISVLLPPPFHMRTVSHEALPYVQALLRTQTHMIDAGSFIQSPQFIPPLPPALQARKVVSESKHVGRFDLRLGFLGGRGFDIARNALIEAIGPGYGDDQEMKKAQLCRVIAPTTGLCKSTTGKKKNSAKVDNSDWINPLNELQKKAVNDIVNGKHSLVPYIIFGPAGTGKTLTVCEAVVQVLRRSPRAKILICAPSDAACDVLASRILPEMRANCSGRLMRINWWCRKAASLPPSLLPCTPMSSNGIFSIPPKFELQNASVIVCQCFVAGCLDLVSALDMKKFTHLFIDETSQAMECEALVPMLKVSANCSIILAGDHKQLGPTVRDPIAVELGLGMSIQERLMQLPLYRKSGELGVMPPMIKLVNNYRSHDALLTVPSTLFYGGALNCCAPKEVTSPFLHLGGLGPAEFPMLLYDVCEGKESTIMDTPSFYNIEECKAILKIIQGLLKSKKADGTSVTNTGDIAVITPFRSQVLMLRRKLRLNGLGSINVGVVEDFQGQETSIVIISTVLTQPHKRWSRFSKDEDVETRLGFMHDPKRFNVAITRARAVCVVVGHSQHLRESETYWTALIEHIERNDGIIRNENCRAVKKKGADDEDGAYGIQKLVKRVEELKLLGSGFEEEKYDLAFYYEDTPQWKVMLA